MLAMHGGRHFEALSLEGSSQVPCGVGRAPWVVADAPKAQEGGSGTGPMAERRGRLPLDHSEERSMGWIALALRTGTVPGGVRRSMYA